MIYKFTNSIGRTNYGAILEHLEYGAVVLMDEFNPTKNTRLPARIRYITLANSKYTITGAQSRDILPADASVKWNTPVIQNIINMMRIGDWEGWWQANKVLISFPQDISRALGITQKLSKSLIGES